MGGTKGASHAAMMLMSLSRTLYFYVANLSFFSFLTSEFCNIVEKHFPYLKPYEDHFTFSSSILTHFFFNCRHFDMIL